MPFRNPHPLYTIWQGMRRRCRTPSNNAWANYGGRGITICPEWDSFSRFVADMGPRPTNLHSIDRIDCDGNYEPGNCRWATRKQQQRNQRCTRHVVVEGKTYIAAELQEQYGIKSDTIVKRAAAGAPFDRVVSRERLLVAEPTWQGAVKARIAKQLARTHCKNGHPWSLENTAYYSKGRYCRICNREKESRRRERLRQSG
jgi:hypothetical protein